MAALTNTIKAEDIAASLDIEMIESFKGDIVRLQEVLDIFSPEVVAAGTTMYTYTVTGSLDTTTVAEGDEVPLSHYEVEKNNIGPITINPYRKLTTAQSILKGGYENAVRKTDAKMLNDVRRDVWGDFFTFLATGTGTATGVGLQAAIAQSDAKLQDTLETGGDASDNLVWFVNPFDIADYLASADVTVQNVFGMRYLESFLGVGNIFVTNKVAKGTLYVTPVENVHLYGVDFGSLGEAGLEYTATDGSLIGVHHTPNYTRTAAETYVLSGVQMLAENLSYIVKGTITAPSAGEGLSS